MFEIMLPVMGPVAVCVAIGYLWKSFGWHFDTEMVTRLIMVVGAPCLIISALGKSPVSRAGLESMIWATVAYVGLGLLISGLVLLLAKQPLRSYLGPLVFPNSGNMGLPICLFAFGERGLVLGLAVFMVLSFAHFTLGLAMVSGRSLVKEMVSNPIVYSLIVAAAMMYTGLRLPLWLERSTDLLGNMTIPLMLITLGVSLSGLRIQHMSLSLFLAVARFALGAGIGWVVAEMFELQGMARAVLMVQAAMPIAVFNYLFAVRYHRNPEVVAGAVMLSTVLSFVWIPLMLTYLR